MNFVLTLLHYKNTCNRSIPELIAIYQYWLLNGTDQNSISYLKQTSQQKISRYLSVPYFLGAKSRNRNFFLDRNTNSVKKLLKFNSDNQKLCLIADGSYTHCEKSTNNQFQYNSYSVQKSDNLIKPFVITCSDGNIIDVYGAFKANQNDANIFEYILNNDIDLNRLIMKNDIIVFDRGFRDNYDF